MSVTFTIEAPVTGLYRAECDLAGELARGTAAEVRAAIGAHPWQACRSCDGYEPMPWSVTDLPDGCEVNLASSNAQRVLLALAMPGAECDLAGELPAADFLGRVLLALADDLDDDEVPGTQIGRVIVAGRRQGYLTHTLLRLHSLALDAMHLHRLVIWA